MPANLKPIFADRLSTADNDEECQLRAIEQSVSLPISVRATSSARSIEWITLARTRLLFMPGEYTMAASEPDSKCSNASISQVPVAAVLNESFVRAYFPKGNPIGQRFGGGALQSLQVGSNLRCALTPQIAVFLQRLVDDPFEFGWHVRIQPDRRNGSTI
jgi:hypothetical protein